ncbi:hypothetical protein HHI36_019790 [Cryptolaemus montrouzieri]|uniref:Luciferin 4-monooxygenase n=1 Tax=Cryptolaemus montrouzieri TaxID=559131 RepID=A0ABD2N8F9_9CUCU
MEHNPHDNHPFIIKTPNESPVPDHGLGYEIFYGMKKYPENIAQYVAETEESQTYQELLDNCIRVAINLQKENLGEEDIVGLCVGNHKHACVPYAAGLFIGKIVTALDPEVVPEEKAKMLQKVTPKILFVDENALENIEESLKIANLNIKIVVIGENTNGHRSYNEYLHAPEDDIKEFQPVKLNSNRGTAVIFFSSGTTGVPKGICLSHFSILTNINRFPLPVLIVFSQLNWISYAILVFRAFRNGTARVLMEKFDIEKVWRAVEKYEVTSIFASVFQVAEFAKVPKPEDVDISSLRSLMCGGSKLPPDIFLRLKKLYPTVLTVQVYGLTEIGGLAISFNMRNPIHRELQLKKPGSCGTVNDGIWYKIVDPDTEEILGPNQPGELRLKSELGMVGYYNMDSTQEYDSGGWLKTGDIFQYDEDLCFYVVDRIKDFIKYRCWAISSSTLEHVLMSHPAVNKAAVIGIPHDEESDFPMGIVTLEKGCEVDPKSLETYVEERVLDRQRLRAGVKILKDIPITSTGKIQKRILRKMAMERHI